MNTDLSPVISLLIENQAMLKTLLILQIQTLSFQIGEPVNEINQRISDAIDKNIELTWESFFQSFPELRKQ